MRMGKWRVTKFGDPATVLVQGRDMEPEAPDPVENEEGGEQDPDPEAIFNEGYERGFADACEDRDAQLDILQQRLQQTAVELPQALARALGDVCEQFRAEVADLAVRMAEVVLRDPALRGTVLSSALQEVLAEGFRPGDLTVSVSPEDGEWLEQAGGCSAASGVRLDVDAGLPPGDAVIRAEDGFFDASLSHRVSQVRDAVARALAHETEHD